MPEQLPLTIAIILVLGVGAQWVAWRVGLPSILLLLSFGICAGPVLGWIDPDESFGELLLPIVSLSVALILYEGGLTLKLSELGRTDRWDARIAEVPLRRAGTDEEVGELIGFLCSPRAAYITGQSVNVNGGSITER